MISYAWDEPNRTWPRVTRQGDKVDTQTYKEEWLYSYHSELRKGSASPGESKKYA